MGDELALRNDPHWREDPAHVHDNRWMHRPPMDWIQAARRSDPDSVEGRVFAAIRGLAGPRRALLALRSGGETQILPNENRSVLAYRRAHPRSAPFLSLTNFSDVTQSVDAGVLARAAPREPQHVHSATGDLVISAGRLELPPGGLGWLHGARCTSRVWTVTAVSLARRRLARDRDFRPCGWRGQRICAGREDVRADDVQCTEHGTQALVLRKLD